MTGAPLTQHWRTGAGRGYPDLHNEAGASTPAPCRTHVHKWEDDPEGGGGSSRSGFQGTPPPFAIIAKSKNFDALQHGDGPNLQGGIATARGHNPAELNRNNFEMTKTKPQFDSTCRRCGTGITTRGTRRKYCGDTCRKYAWKARREAETRAWLHRLLTHKGDPRELLSTLPGRRNA